MTNKQNLPDNRESTALVIGGDGLIGRSLGSALRAAGWTVICTTRRQKSLHGSEVFMDLKNPSTFPTLPSCEVTILCASDTSINDCRLDPNRTRLINVSNTILLAKRLLSSGSHLIFLSSNMVFDGQKPFSAPTDNTCPVTEYGQQKADAEAALLCLLGRISIVRFSKIITPSLPLIAGWVKDLGIKRAIYPFIDASMSPISLNFATELLLRVINCNKTGIIQASARTDITYYEAAIYLAKFFGYSPGLIHGVSYSEKGFDFFPKNTTLDCSELQTLGLTAPRAETALNDLSICFNSLQVNCRI